MSTHECENEELPKPPIEPVNFPSDPAKFKRQIRRLVARRLQLWQSRLIAAALGGGIIAIIANVTAFQHFVGDMKVAVRSELKSELTLEMKDDLKDATDNTRKLQEASSDQYLKSIQLVADATSKAIAQANIVIKDGGALDTDQKKLFLQQEALADAYKKFEKLQADPKFAEKVDLLEKFLHGDAAAQLTQMQDEIKLIKKRSNRRLEVVTMLVGTQKAIEVNNFYHKEADRNKEMALVTNSVRSATPFL